MNATFWCRFANKTGQSWVNKQPARDKTRISASFYKIKNERKKHGFLSLPFLHKKIIEDEIHTHNVKTSHLASWCKQEGGGKKENDLDKWKWKSKVSVCKVGGKGRKRKRERKVSQLDLVLLNIILLLLNYTHKSNTPILQTHIQLRIPAKYF